MHVDTVFGLSHSPCRFTTFCIDGYIHNTDALPLLMLCCTSTEVLPVFL
jgi:hypothetical protein